MNTLITLKKIALQREDEYLQRSLKLLDGYIDKHVGANLTAYINDGYVTVYDGDVLLLKILTSMLNVEEDK